MFESFAQLRKLVLDAGGQIRALGANVEKLKQERDLIDAAPLSKRDTIAALHARIDAAGASHLKIFSTNLTQLVAKGDPARVDTNILAAHRHDTQPSLAGFEAAICLAFADQMKAAAHRIVDAMPWPAGSLDHVEKQKRLGELDRKIAAAESELTELVQSARAAGLNV